MDTRHEDVKQNSSLGFFQPSKIQLKPPIQIKEMYVKSLEVMADGNYLLESDDGNIVIANAEKGEVIKKIGETEFQVSPEMVSTPNNRIYTSFSHGNICEWDSKTGERTEVFKGHQYTVTSLLGLNNDEIFSASVYEDPMFLWDVKSAQYKWRVAEHPQMFDLPFINKCFSLLRYMNLSEYLLTYVASYLPFEKEDFGKVSAVAKHSSGDIICGTTNGILFVLDRQTGSYKQVFRGYEGEKVKHCGTDWYQVYSKRINVIASLPNGDIVTGSRNGPILIWDLKTENIKHRCVTDNCQNFRVYDLQVYKDYVFSISENGYLHVWDSKSGTCLKEVTNVDHADFLGINKNGDLLIPHSVKWHNNLIYTLPLEYLLKNTKDKFSFAEIPFPAVEEQKQCSPTMSSRS